MKHTGAQNASIDLNRLGTFTAVAEEHSFAHAARRLGVQRSSVSRSVAALEESLGVMLFQRTTRHVAMTAEGAALYAQVSPQLAGLRDAMRSLPERDAEVSGTLRLTAPVDLGVTLLPPIVATFAARYPRVRLDLQLDNRVVNLVKERFDAALRPQPARREDSSLVSRKVMDLFGALYASPGYLAARGTPRTAEDLIEHDWISFRGRALPAPVPRLPPARIVVDELLFMREALKQGLGIGVLATHFAHADVLAGRLVRVLPKQGAFRVGLHLIHPPARHMPRRLAAFRDHFLEQVRQGSSTARDASLA